MIYVPRDFTFIISSLTVLFHEQTGTWADIFTEFPLGATIFCFFRPLQVP